MTSQQNTLASTIISSPKSDLPYLEEEFGFPTGVAVDSEGSIIFLDTYNGKVLKFKRETGKIITIAGSSYGFRDGKGLNAKFDYCQGIAISRDDVIYVGDNGNQAIRKITKDGIVSTILSGDKVGDIQDITFYNAEDTVYYVSKTFVSRVQSDGSRYMLWAGSSQAGDLDGKGSQARFSEATGITVNQYTGDIYVGEFAISGSIRKIDKNQTVTTIVKGLSGPSGMVVVKNEFLAFTEYFGNRIKSYSLDSKKVTVLAGVGDMGMFDGLGTDAALAMPSYITWNPLTDEFIFSEWANGIRMVNKFQYVSTVLMPVGFGAMDGPPQKARISSNIVFDIDDNEEILYFLTPSLNLLRKASLSNGTVTTIGGKLYPGNVIGNLKDSLFSNPSGIGYYNGTLLIADQNNNMIKKVLLDNNTIENFKEITKPEYIYVDKYQSSFFMIYLSFGLSIPKYDMNGNLILSLGIGSSGCRDDHYTKAQIYKVRNIYSTKDGNAYFTDEECNTVRVFNASTGFVSLLAGKSETKGYVDGIGIEALFNVPFSLDYYEAEEAFYISDLYSNLIRKMTMNGNVTTFAGSIEEGYRNGPINIALFSGQTFLKVLSNGDIVIADNYNYAVRIIKKKSGKVMTLFGYGNQKYLADPDSNVDLNYPISITSKGENIYILNKEDNNIIGYDLKTSKKVLVAGNGAIGWSDGDKLEAMFNRPEGIHYSAACDCIYVADTKNHLIRTVTMQGIVSTFAGRGKAGSKNDNLLASDFNLPSSVTTDASGKIYVADSGNHAIREISNGKVKTYAGVVGAADLVNGRLLFTKFNFPTGIAYNPMSDCLVVADMYNHAIRNINSTHVTTMAGNGTYGFLDGPFSISLFAYPRKLSIDINGEIYVTDSFNDRIRKLSNGAVTTISNAKHPSGLHVNNGVLYFSESRDNMIKSVFVGIQNTSKSSEISSNSISPVITLTIISFLIIGLATFLVMQIRLKFKRQIVTETLMKIQSNSGNARKPMDKTGTITLNQTLAIAIPGYLEIDVMNSVKFAKSVGQGGTAEVVLGSLEDAKLIEKFGFSNVAVKFVNEKSSLDDFYYEITIMSAIPKSENIVELVGYSTRPLSIVMKSYPSSLSDVIKSGTFANDFPLKLKLAIDIAKGMEIIHKSRVIHFDLKPANILISNNQNSLTAVICDFGFANFSSDAKVNLVKGVKAPRTNGITARYAAPEQFFGNNSFYRLDEDIYKKVDVFAYGMTIYFIFTGLKPWQSEDKVEKIVELVCSGERPEIPENSVPNEVGPLIQICWSQEAFRRPSFKEIVDELLCLQNQK